ncbi:hypothetical protein PFISCL1PPCAC_20643, partial [Pristionchus fissidentatus]
QLQRSLRRVRHDREEAELHYCYSGMSVRVMVISVKLVHVELPHVNILNQPVALHSNSYTSMRHSRADHKPK